MFTGIIQSLGSVISMNPTDNGMKLALNIGDMETDRLQVGDSISVNGVCLTLNQFERNMIFFDVSSETLSSGLIGKWQVGERINMETALTLQTPIGGHLVSGHVDGTAQVIERKDEQEFTAMRFETECVIGKFIAAKGSVAIDGVSLTTNTVADHNNRTQFEIMLIPHTLENTTLGNLEKDSQVHVEVDQIARYIHRMGECTEIPDSNPKETVQESNIRRSRVGACALWSRNPVK